MGYILAPYGFGYRTHGAAHKAEDDSEFFKKDKKLRGEVEGVVNNVVETMALDLEKRLSGKITCVSE